MPKQGTQSQSTDPEHVEQVLQNRMAKGDLVMASGDDWAGDDATDSVYLAAEPDSWFDARMRR